MCQLIAREKAAGAEVASSGELAVARAAGFEPEDIVFAGPGKTDDELERVVQEGIFADNVESLGEIERLAQIAAGMGRKIGVGLRINPAAQLMGSQMRMGGTVGQFGMDQAELEEAVEKTLSHPDLILRGIHVYTATQVFEVEPLLEHCRNIFEIALEAADYAGHPLEMIDFGGGFGVPYFEKMSEFDLERFGEGFRELLSTYRSDPRLEGCRFLFELGRYLVADAGVYVTRVVDVKRTRGKTFVVTDGGMNHHLTATGNMGQVFRQVLPPAEPDAHGRGARGGHRGGGPLLHAARYVRLQHPTRRPRGRGPHRRLLQRRLRFLREQPRFPEPPRPSRSAPLAGRGAPAARGGKPEDVLDGQEPLES